MALGQDAGADAALGRASAVFDHLVSLGQERVGAAAGVEKGGTVAAGGPEAGTGMEQTVQPHPGAQPAVQDGDSRATGCLQGGKPDIASLARAATGQPSQSLSSWASSQSAAVLPLQSSGNQSIP